MTGVECGVFVFWSVPSYGVDKRYPGVSTAIAVSHVPWLALQHVKLAIDCVLDSVKSSLVWRAEGKAGIP